MKAGPSTARVLKVPRLQESKTEEYTIKSVIRGHHVDKSNWHPILGEQLILEREDGNSLDRHTVSVMKGGAIISHVPRELLVHTGTLSDTVGQSHVR